MGQCCWSPEETRSWLLNDEIAGCMICVEELASWRPYSNLIVASSYRLQVQPVFQVLLFGCKLMSVIDT